MMEILNPKETDSVLVELFHFQDKLRIFIARSDFKEPKVISQRLSINELNEIVEILLSNLSMTINQWSNSAWKNLSELVCEPLEVYLRENDRIIIVPHKLFHSLPLHLLILDGHPLMDRHAIIYSPSASVLQYCQKKNPKRINPLFQPSSLLAFGLDFEEEVDIVASYFKSPRVIRNSDGSITKEVISSACSGNDVIHFSGHGEFQKGSVDKSGLVLNAAREQCDAKRRIFNLYDIYNLRLNSYLVALGACNSGLGDYQAGDELLGIVRGFLYAGTPTVLASLWPVPNKPTICLMKAFYLHLMEDGLDKANSLRLAQLDVRKSYPHVSEWAGFTMVGDWL